MTEATPEQRLLVEVCLQHLIAFLWRGPGLLLVSRQGLPTLLSVLASKRVRVLGMEAFELEGAAVHPRLDLIYDADRLPGFPSPDEVIETWPDDVWVDVTISGLS